MEIIVKTKVAIDQIRHGHIRKYIRNTLDPASQQLPLIDLTLSLMLHAGRWWCVAMPPRTVHNQKSNKQTNKIQHPIFFFRCFSTYLTVKYNMQILRRCRQCEKHIKTIFYYTQEDYINFQFHTKKKHLPHCGTFVSPSPIHRPVWLINSLSLSRSLSFSPSLVCCVCIIFAITAILH